MYATIDNEGIRQVAFIVGFLSGILALAIARYIEGNRRLTLLAILLAAPPVLATIFLIASALNPDLDVESPSLFLVLGHVIFLQAYAIIWAASIVGIGAGLLLRRMGNP